jgi:anti-sigma factor RsiW
VSEKPDLHPDELLQELLDDRLEGEERAAIEAHVESCPRCQRLRESLLSSRRVLRSAPAGATTEELGGMLEGVLARGVERDESASSKAESAMVRALRQPGWQFAAGVAAALVVVFGTLLLPSQWAGRKAVDELLALHAAATPVFGETAPAALEERLAGALPFRARVLDLAAMDVRLLGGGTSKVAGRPAGWMLYSGPASERLLCVMFRGRLAALPATDETRERGPFTFRVYRRGPRTIVAWQEGALVCALVGEGDAESVIALAQAKAMLPAPS